MRRASTCFIFYTLGCLQMRPKVCHGRPSGSGACYGGAIERSTGVALAAVVRIGVILTSGLPCASQEGLVVVTDAVHVGVGHVGGGVVSAFAVGVSNRT